MMQRTSNTRITENMIKAMRERDRDKTGFPLRMLSGGYDATAYAVERLNGKQYFASTSGPVWNINRLRFRDVDVVINRSASSILSGDPYRPLPGISPFPVGDGGGDGDPNKPYPVNVERTVWPNDPNITGPHVFPSLPPMVPPAVGVPYVVSGNPAQLYVDPTSLTIKIFSGTAYDDFNLYFWYVGTENNAGIGFKYIKVEILVGSSWMRVYYYEGGREVYREVHNEGIFATSIFPLNEYFKRMRVGASISSAGLTGYLKLTMVCPLGCIGYNSSGDEISVTIPVVVEEGTYNYYTAEGAVQAVLTPVTGAPTYYNGKRVYSSDDSLYLYYWEYATGKYTWVMNPWDVGALVTNQMARLWPASEDPVGTYVNGWGGFKGTLEENE